MRVTVKGQVTIPRRIRDKAGIVPGSEVEFVERSGQVYLRKTRGRGRAKDLIARMRGRGSVRMSTDEILALTRGDR